MGRKNNRKNGPQPQLSKRNRQITEYMPMTEINRQHVRALHLASITN